METQYQTFRNWDIIDCEEFLFQKDKDNRQIDDPELNQDDLSQKQQEDFDDSDDFHKYDDTDNDRDNSDSSDAETSGSYDGNINI